MMVPCGTSYKLADGSEAQVRDDCVWEKDAVVEYLGPLMVTAYINDVSFEQDKYEGERLNYYSTIKQTMANPA